MSHYLPWSVRNSEAAALSHGVTRLGTGCWDRRRAPCPVRGTQWGAEIEISRRKWLLQRSCHHRLSFRCCSGLSAFSPCPFLHTKSLASSPPIADSTVPYSPCCLSWPRSHLTASKQTFHHSPQSPTVLNSKVTQNSFPL